MSLSTVSHQAPLFTGFPSQEYWSGLPFPSPGDLPDPWIEPKSPTLADRFFTTEPPGKRPKMNGHTLLVYLRPYVKVTVQFRKSYSLVTIGYSE